MEVHTAEIHSAEIRRSEAEFEDIFVAQIGFDMGLVLPPLVPRRGTFFQYLEMCFGCHAICRVNGLELLVSPKSNFGLLGRRFQFFIASRQRKPMAHGQVQIGGVVA